MQLMPACRVWCGIIQCIYSLNESTVCMGQAFVRCWTCLLEHFWIGNGTKIISIAQFQSSNLTSSQPLHLASLSQLFFFFFLFFFCWQNLYLSCCKCGSLSNKTLFLLNPNYFYQKLPQNRGHNSIFPYTLFVKLTLLAIIVFVAQSC